MHSINNLSSSSQEATHKTNHKRDKCKSKKRNRKADSKSREVVYLLHFSQPYKHAKHYLGSTQDLDQRLNEHKEGKGARLTQVVLEAGITVECVRTWKGGRKEERRLKNFRKATALCVICRIEVNAKRRARYHAKRKENSN